MGLSTNNLILSRKVVRTVGGFTLMCQGWLPVEFNVQGKTTKQARYICKKSKGCISAKQPALTYGYCPKTSQTQRHPKKIWQCNIYHQQALARNWMQAPNIKSRISYQRVPKNYLPPILKTILVRRTIRAG